MIAPSVLEDYAVLGGAAETTIRDLVADQLAVDAGEFGRDVSLVDDLAADSLDLAEIAVAIEGELGVVLPRRFLDHVRTFGDLIDATLSLARAGRARRGEEPPVPLRAHILPAGTSPSWTVEHVLLLTPYAAETLSVDATRAGTGGRLELVLAADANEQTIAGVQSRFAALADRGVEVDVRRDSRARRRASAA